MVRESFRKSFASLQMAQAIAIQMLGHLVDDEEKLAGFLALSGLGPDNLRQAAQSPAFLQAVLDFICADEALLRALAIAAQRSPEEIDHARRVLAGPEPDWGA